MFWEAGIIQRYARASEFMHTTQGMLAILLIAVIRDLQ
jgi:hypothetical protein